MLDQILFWLEVVMLILVSIAMTRRFRKVRSFSWLIGVVTFGIVLKLTEACLFYLLVLKPHAADKVVLLFTERSGQANVILLGFALALALYHLGGKPTRGFWQWLFAEDGPEEPSTA